ncbi:hypothetical protein [Micromonospora lupini]|uniref:hypothetical protein n=1 Tax=Micromonospora lupini TaxID=285679 RepID=UPI0031D7DEBE
MAIETEASVSTKRALLMIRAILATLALTAGWLVAAVQPAAASASGCTYGGRPVDRCVYVNGSSTYVNYIVGTIRYTTGQYLEIEVWGDGIYYRGHGDPGTPSDTTQVRLNINRNLTNGSWVCVAARWTDGSQVSPACVQIKR